MKNYKADTAEDATAILGFFKEYRWLSNFWATTIEDDGIVYPSSEHFYQALKTKNKSLPQQIAKLPIKNVRSYCRQIKIRDNWDSGKNLRVRAMWKVTVLKYKNAELRKKLLATAGQHLEEVNYWGDTFWGTVQKNNNRIGENTLGQILMAYRDYLLDVPNKKVSRQIQKLKGRK